MKNPVFVISLFLVLLFVGLGIYSPKLLDELSSVVHSSIIDHFGWGYLLSAFVFLVFAIYLGMRYEVRYEHPEPSQRQPGTS